MAQGPSSDSDRASLELLITGFQVTRLLGLVAELGIADRIPPDGQVAISTLARDAEVQEAQLLRVLRALAAFHVFTVQADGAIGHTARSRLLRADTPQSLRHAARFWSTPGSWRAWENLDVALRGEVPHEAAWGTGRFAYLAQHPAEARIFDAMMANFPGDRHTAFAAAYDFSATRQIVDVGGGNGATLRGILNRYPDTRGLVFDRPDVVAAMSEADRLAGRISTQGGSFFENVPTGGDCYLLVLVLHDWGDADCQRILRACRAVMSPDAVLLIGEHLLEPDPMRGRIASYQIDMQMMAMFGAARERTEAEYGALLASNGFALRRSIATQGALFVIEAVPA